MNQRTVLVTGATGYIASHVCVLLLQRGFEVIGLDNLSNSTVDVLERVREIAGRPIPFMQADVRDTRTLSEVLAGRRVEAVLHFAGLKSVSESVAQPLSYFDNNVHGTVTLLQAMSLAQVKRLIFSSSATVYGQPEVVPIQESARVSVTNPYGRSKLFVEEILADLHRSDSTWSIGVLRYFNPVGAHSSGLIGEKPKGTPNNLMPYIAEVAVGLRPYVSVFGGDYPTADGTGVRDYIHVMDLAEAHVAALEHLLGGNPGFTLNVGTGRGYSVLEVIRAYERASGRPIPHKIVARRPGDVAECFADPTAAQELLGWSARLPLDRMCADQWRWQQHKESHQQEGSAPTPRGRAS
ncbi:UDP-glucose 4-epimerase GalE [Ramlibacter sp. AW1]|uniref:UDP-glucose 4-epimerase n=1 Tax=Ramlibacter aurantiacus TaxID=2801330 RepID=A0A936ZRR5_9BURK|nr:UDP-glucose 4-epimerase GalE [Ramlibacter aurantiacus]MBL0422268.1 UDP-glucose 4-epimerase GalE [Ramlibacter aurantiacus]